MNSRERILLALNHKEADRVAIEDSPWGTTEARWHKEGLPEGIGPREYFDYELRGFGADLSLRLPSEMIEETDEYKIERSSQGAIVRNWKQKTSTPQYLDFTIKDRKTWEEMKPMTAWDDTRVNWENALRDFKTYREQGKFLCFSAAMGYDKTQGIVGSERLLMAMVTDPGWVKDMFDNSADMLIAACEEMLSRGMEFDGAFLYDDMGYRNTSLFSPKMYRELLFPAHKKANDFMKSKGLPTLLHSCGCVLGFVPMLIEAGWKCLNPLEQKAGMDLFMMKKKFGGDLCFLGGIDARKLSQSEDALEEEIRSKITFAKKGGGYIYSVDHSVPDDVSFSNYKKTIEFVMKYGKY